MKIVFDTNVMFKHWHLKGPNIELFEKFLKLSDAKLVVPKIVTAEVKNKYKETIEKACESASTKFKQLRGLLLPSIELEMTPINMKVALTDYEKAFEARLRSLDVETPGHGDIPHHYLVARDLARRRPFQDSGKGYRDTLLWEVILRKVADKSNVTILMTSNHNDFGESIDKLHKHLRQDLRLKGLPEDCVQLCNSIEMFNEKYVKPRLSVLKEIKLKLEKGIYHGFSVDLWFEKNTSKIIDRLQPEADSLFVSDPLGRYINDVPMISYIEKPSKLTIENVFELDLNRVFIDVIAETEVSIEFFISKTDYYIMPDDIQLNVLNEDWNAYSVFASTTKK